MSDSDNRARWNGIPGQNRHSQGQQSSRKIKTTPSTKRRGHDSNTSSQFNAPAMQFDLSDTSPFVLAFHALKTMLQPLAPSRMSGKLTVSDTEQETPKDVIDTCCSQLQQLMKPVNHKYKADARKKIKSKMTEAEIDLDQLCLWNYQQKTDLMTSLRKNKYTSTYQLVSDNYLLTEHMNLEDSAIKTLAFKLSVLSSLLDEKATHGHFSKRTPVAASPRIERLNIIKNILSILFTAGIANLIYGLMTHGKSYWIGTTLTKPLSSALAPQFGRLFSQTPHDGIKMDPLQQPADDQNTITNPLLTQNHN